MLDRLKTLLGIAKPTEKRSITGLENWLPAPTTSGMRVDEANALQFAAVWAAVSVLANGVGSIGFKLVRRLPDGGKVVDHSNPIHDLISLEPNEDNSAFALIVSIMVHLLTYGNAYLEIVHDELLRPVKLYLLDPRKVQPARTSTGTLYYQINGIAVSASSIIHVSGMGFDGLVGYSPIQHLRECVGVGLALERFAASFFGNGLNARGVLTVPDELSELAQANLRKSLKQVHGGVGSAHETLILEQGTTWTSTSTANNEGQFLESRKFQVIEICRALNVPPTKLMDFERSTFSNIEEVNIDWYQSSLLPWLLRIEHAFNRKLLTPAQRQVWAVEHDVSQVIRGRLQDRVAVWDRLLTQGVLCRDEVRAELSLGPIPDGTGKVYLIPANNMQPLALAAPGGKLPVDNAPIDPDSDGIDVPASEADIRQLPDNTAQHEAVKAVVLDTAHRMVRRECGALTKLAKRPDLRSLVEGIDEFYTSERQTLVDAFGPAVRAYSTVTGTQTTVEAFASRALATSTQAIRTVIEGSNTHEALAQLIEDWSVSKAGRMLALLEEKQ